MAWALGSQSLWRAASPAPADPELRSAPAESVCSCCRQARGPGGSSWHTSEIGRRCREEPRTVPGRVVEQQNTEAAAFHGAWPPQWSLGSKPPGPDTGHSVRTCRCYRSGLVEVIGCQRAAAATALRVGTWNQRARMELQEAATVDLPCAHAASSGTYCRMNRARQGSERAECDAARTTASFPPNDQPTTWAAAMCRESIAVRMSPTSVVASYPEGEESEGGIPRRVIPTTRWRSVKRGAKSSNTCADASRPARNTTGSPVPHQSRT
jgi:hypothetical protein